MSRIDYVIHKTEFRSADKLELDIPLGSRVVHIAEQEKGRIQIWYERPMENFGQFIKVKLYCFGTGHRIDVTNLRADYFKTVVMSNGLVWHFYINYSKANNDNKIT